MRPISGPMFLLVVLLTGPAGAQDSRPALEPDLLRSIERITAAGLRAHVEYLASDALEGRDTPSPGLDKAAEYIAAFFRDHRVARGGGEDWFQVFEMASGEPDPARCSLEIEVAGERAVHAPGEGFDVTQSGLPRVLMPIRDREVLAFDKARKSPDRRIALAREPSGVGVAGRDGVYAAILATGAGEPVAESHAPRRRPQIPILTLDEALAEQVARPGARVSLTLATMEGKPVRNVVGLVKGRDSALAAEAVLVTAHYDHIGVTRAGEGDRICNGADDDASGTAAVMAIADALAALPRPPRRTVVFVLFFGEEKGLLGSAAYARVPVVPLERTVANVNIEMVGRPDDIGRKEAWITGFQYSTFGERLAEAARPLGFRFYRHETRSDQLFRASDNWSFVRHGVPAHSISAGSLHRDYHRPSDEASKLDYGNMEAVVRALCVATHHLAEVERAPEWTEAGRARGYSRN